MWPEPLQPDPKSSLKSSFWRKIFPHLDPPPLWHLDEVYFHESLPILIEVQSKTCGGILLLTWMGSVSGWKIWKSIIILLCFLDSRFQALIPILMEVYQTAHQIWVNQVVIDFGMNFDVYLKSCLLSSSLSFVEVWDGTLKCFLKILPLLVKGTSTQEKRYSYLTLLYLRYLPFDFISRCINSNGTWSRKQSGASH